MNEKHEVMLFQREDVVSKFPRLSVDGALVYFTQQHSVQASDFSLSIFRSTSTYWWFYYVLALRARVSLFYFDLDYIYLFQSIRIGPLSYDRRVVVEQSN